MKFELYINRRFGDMEIKKRIKFLALAFFAIFSFVHCQPEDSGDKTVYSDSAQAQVALGESPSSAAAASDNISNSRRNAVTRAVEKCTPAIVGINVTEVRKVVYKNPFSDPLFDFFFGGRPRVKQYQVRGLGSGFIVSPDGYALTNHHVAGAASKIVITMTNGRKYDAEIIGADKTSDVALLKINSDEGEKFPYLKLGDSDDIIPGEWAIAFGNPFGLFDINAKPTVTIGVVSNSGVNFIQEGRVYRGMIQTDAAISSGNSGGPLVNSLGEVIGMNTVIFSTAQSSQGAGSIGVGFSIPINRVKEILSVLKKRKRVDRNYDLGMEVRDIDEKIARYLGIDLKSGVVVSEVRRRSPAAEAGIEPGDVILQIDDLRVLRSEDFYVAALDGIAGEHLHFKILRGEKVLDKKAYLKPIRK